ncbi:MAG: protein kinase [Bryobacteraceae bacterium]|jgi:two-component system LytT family response regulator
MNTTAIQPGTVLGQYEIVSRLGEGGMGQVWLARDTRLERHVALKVLPLELRENPDRLRRFLQEARIASSLSHPNICYLHEIGEAGGVSWIAMEYVEGESLAKIVAARAPLPVDEMVSISLQIADALDAAWARGIVHRDIKPANVMVTPRGHVKVLDFGLARVRMAEPEKEATQLLTVAGALLGTVHYMSPEQALGRDVDGRSDVFSLGTVMYEMATGRLPFAGPGTPEVIAHILNDQPEAMARFNYSLPQEFERAVRKCLEKDRERRYQSARELMVDLRNLERDRGSGPVSGPGESGRTVIRAMIVDDEDLARAVLREFANSTKDIAVIGECANGFEAVKSIAEHKPDVVFLDVQMPKLDGFEVLELIDDDVSVIFCTAFDQYAMRAFDAHALDYLLKPFSLERFQTAVDRVRERVGHAAPRPSAQDLAAAARPPQQYANRIVVKDGTRVHVIPVAQLDCVEAQDDYVGLHTQGKTWLKQQTITSLEATLDPQQFIRVHRSWIVNFERVTRIEPYSKDSRLAILADGTKVPVSRAGYERLKVLLDEKG